MTIATNTNENESTSRKKIWLAHKGEWEYAATDEPVCSRSYVQSIGAQIMQKIGQLENNVTKLVVGLFIFIMLSVGGLIWLLH